MFLRKGLFLKANFCIDTCRNWLKQYFLHIIYKVSQPGHNWQFTCLPDNYSMNKTILKAVLHRSIHFIFNSLSFPPYSHNHENGVSAVAWQPQWEPLPHQCAAVVDVCVFQQMAMIILYDILNHKFRINCHVSCDSRREELSSHQPLSSLDHHSGTALFMTLWIFKCSSGRMGWRQDMFNVGEVFIITVLLVFQEMIIIF